jgi:hypothetical protein
VDQVIFKVLKLALNIEIVVKVFNFQLKKKSDLNEVQITLIEF